MKAPNVNDPKVKKDIEQNKLIAAVGYIGLLCLVPLILKRDSQYAQWHGKQGLLLVIGWAINFFIGIFPIIGWLISFFLSIALIVFSVMGILKSLAGEYWDIPYVGQYRDKINL